MLWYPRSTEGIQGIANLMAISDDIVTVATKSSALRQFSSKLYLAPHAYSPISLLPRLDSVSISNGGVDVDFFAHLSQAPALRKVSTYLGILPFMVGLPQLGFKETSVFEFKRDGFRNLEHVDFVQSDASLLSNLFTLITTSCPDASPISVSFEINAETRTQDVIILKLISAVSLPGFARRLRRISLIIDHRACLFTLPPIIFTSIAQPLLNIRTLEEICIHVLGRPIIVTSEEVTHMASAWPNLVSLQITHNQVFFPSDYWSSNEASLLEYPSLDSIVGLAGTCQKLEVLAMNMASALDEDLFAIKQRSVSAPLQRTLTTMIPSVSEERRERFTITDVQLLARELHAFFPYLRGTGMVGDSGTLKRLKHISTGYGVGQILMQELDYLRRPAVDAASTVTLPSTSGALPFRGTTVNMSSLSYLYSVAESLIIQDYFPLDYGLR